MCIDFFLVLWLALYTSRIYYMLCFSQFVILSGGLYCSLHCASHMLGFYPLSLLSVVLSVFQFGHILSLCTFFSRHVLGSFLFEFPAALDTSRMWLLDTEAAKVSIPSLVIKVPAGVTQACNPHNSASSLVSLYLIAAARKRRKPLRTSSSSLSKSLCLGS